MSRAFDTAAVRQGGVGLIEILVTVVILSIGFLAVARMQVQGMRISQDAYHRSQAYFLATDMIDRMRSNVPGVLKDKYDELDTSAEANDPGCDAKACTAAELAEQDLFDWSASFHVPSDEAATRVAALPSSDSTTARGQVRPVAGKTDQYEVKVFWAETVGSADVERHLALTFAAEIPE